MASETYGKKTFIFFPLNVAVISEKKNGSLSNI